eukprot:767755-Hanusia_phi.AAC.5
MLSSSLRRTRLWTSCSSRSPPCLDSFRKFFNNLQSMLRERTSTAETRQGGKAQIVMMVMIMIMIQRKKVMLMRKTMMVSGRTRDRGED